MRYTMNIAVDIDDTLTDSFDYFMPFAAEFFGADVDELRRMYNGLGTPAAKKFFIFCSPPNLFAEKIVILS